MRHELCVTSDPSQVIREFRFILGDLSDLIYASRFIRPMELETYALPFKLAF